MPRGLRKTRKPDAGLHFEGQGKRGRWRAESPIGTIHCTLGNHDVPIAEMPTQNQRGTVRMISWCYSCKRDYDREAQRRHRAKSTGIRRAAE